MDDRIAKLHQQIFNRNIVPWPPTAGYIPDAVKYYRLPKEAKIYHYRNTVEALGRIPNFNLSEYKQNLAIPHGFDDVNDYLAAVSRDKFGDNFQHMERLRNRNATYRRITDWTTQPAEPLYGSAV